MPTPHTEIAPPVVVVTGLTATGKTPLAIELAQRFDGEIINADSMQVFRFMNIGTAKPSLEQRAQVPHHLLDQVTPDVPYSAGRYSADARQVATDIHQRGKIPFVTGGTGLYIRAFLEGLIEGADPDPALRDKLEREHEEAVEQGDPHRLHRRLTESDPEAAARIHPNDARRVVRALEIEATIGEPTSRVRRTHGFADRRFRALHLALDLSRDALAPKIDARCQAMIESGLLQEVRDLHSRGYGPGLRPLQGIGYRHMAPVIRGEDTLANALIEMQSDTRRFARRQRTWLRAVPEAIWLDPRQPGDASRLVESFLTPTKAEAQSVNSAP